jgi:hypothetical protein
LKDIIENNIESIVFTMMNWMLTDIVELLHLVDELVIDGHDVLAANVLCPVFVEKLETLSELDEFLQHWLLCLGDVLHCVPRRSRAGKTGVGGNRTTGDTEFVSEPMGTIDREITWGKVVTETLETLSETNVIDVEDQDTDEIDTRRTTTG